MIKYVLHPGWVTSKVDGDRHFIGVGKLVHLYGVDPAECTLDPFLMGGVIHLFPRRDGNYRLPSG